MGDLVQIAHEGDLGSFSGPLVTYRIQCYRHEGFVQSALSSVLAQTYKPLEILLTDDGSPDGTFEVAKEVASQYRGPHRIVLYRSETNRDILAHWNDALHWMRGSFFLSMSGDDMAEPAQVEELVAQWMQSGAGSSVWTNYRMIDANGRDLGIGLPPGHPYTLNLCDYADGRFLDFPYGGLGGYTREVIDRFGDAPAHLGSRGLEHHIGFRAALLGPKRHIGKTLFRKRYHPNRATAGHNAKDQELDPMIVNERQIRVRLQVLTGCRDVIAECGGSPKDPSRAALVHALGVQISAEVRRLLEFEAYRERARRLAEQGTPPAPHSGWQYAPNGLTLVRELPQYQCNMIAGECMYYAAPWSVGIVEPCGIRNHAYPGVLRAWTEAELLAALEKRSKTGNGSQANSKTARRLWLRT